MLPNLRWSASETSDRSGQAPLVAKELSRIAELIMRDGKGATSTVTALQALARLVVDIERDTGAPVAKQLTAAIRLSTKLPEPKPYVSPQQFIREMQFKRQLRAMKRPPGRRRDGLAVRAGSPLVRRPAACKSLTAGPLN
jgi:hypothetical protein